MTQEIEEIIKKNLPAQVGDVLKARLFKADVDEKALEAANKNIAALNSQVTTLQNTIAEHRKNDERNAGLDAREKALMERERIQEVTELKIKLEEANKRADMVQNFTLGLVRNIEFRKSISDSQYQASYYDGNNYVQPTPINKSYDETKTAQ